MKDKNLKKWIYTVLIIIGGIFIFFYIDKWSEVKEAEKYLNSYLIETKTISLEMNDLEDIKNVLTETPNYYFVYISYTKDKSIYNLEKKLKPIIDENHLQNYFYFINVTDIKEENKDYLNILKNELKIPVDINEIPTIIYFKNGEYVTSVDNSKDFETLVENEISAVN